jgi:hypothetical protein
VPYRVYVAKLRKRVMEDRRYRAANPQYVSGKPCVYIGATGRTPEDRFEQHSAGYKSNRYVKRFGTSLFGWAYEGVAPFKHWADAEAAERTLAWQYRSMGWAVWQN